MPPKKAATKRTRAANSASPVLASRRSARMSPALGGSNLPNIPTKTSFAYGSSQTPILPHMLAARPQMNLAEMADSIEEAVQTAKLRENSNSPHNTPALGTSARKSAESSPQRTRRQPTPDQVQLLTSLREASSATPSTPTRHSFSSESSVREVAEKQLYPSYMDETPNQAEVPADADLHGLGLDNMSVISYNVERDVHDDDLKRTRSNITAPPRRVSGLDLKHSTILEEDESYRPSPSVDSFAAPAKTVISDHDSRTPISPHSDDSTAQWEKPKDGWIPWLLRALIAALVIFGIYSLLGSASSSDAKPIRFNNSDLNALSSQVANLGAQVSSLSRDMKSVRAEVSNIPAPTTILQYPSKHRQEIIKTNFLTRGNGVIVDPFLTSPSASRKATWTQRLYFWLSGDKHMRPQPPLAAMSPWSDFGDCWCSAPKKGVTQLAVLLGQRIVPEDIVVEHLPKEATIRPQVAPQEMELWARYRYVGNGRPYKNTWFAFFRGYPKNIAGQDPLPSDQTLVRPSVIEALRLAWPGESDDKFSDDKQLGSDFFRIAKWTYDINDANNIQRFPMNAYIDSPDLRVDKVVFRVNSNWGANETCIYRLKLHGKL
ncbi:hypothetical protein BDW60DRAFT_222833 [Aspergillus nidulans var. acristatus]